MYKIGDLVVYGNNGVCRVDDVTKRPFLGEMRDYYVLKPLYDDCIVYTPFDTKVFMRPVITKKRAEELIDEIPQMNAEAYHNPSAQQLAEHYETAINSHKCGDIIELIMSIYLKKKGAAEAGKKFGIIDERFMKQAEEMLYGEFAVALGIEKNDVQAYISKRIEEQG